VKLYTERDKGKLDKKYWKLDMHCRGRQPAPLQTHMVGTDVYLPGSCAVNETKE